MAEAARQRLDDAISCWLADPEIRKKIVLARARSLVSEALSEKRREMAVSLDQAGYPIDAVKMYREATGLGFKECRDFIEVQRGQTA